MLKKNKVLKSISSLVLAMVLTIAGFASNVSAEESKTAYITKYLNIAEGTEVPEADFNFDFELVKAPDGVQTQAIPTATVSFDENDTIENNQIVKSTSDVLSSVTFAKSGLYTYKVTEAEGTYEIDEDNETEEVQYSQAVYNMYVLVANGTDGTYVKSVTVERVIDDNGTAIEDGEGVNNGEKVEPGKPEEGGEVPGADGLFSFTNAYVKTLDNGGEGEIPGLEDENIGIMVGNALTGDFADYDTEFTYSTTLTPATGSSATTFKYFIAEKNAEGKWVPVGTTRADITYSTGSYGEALTTTLKHNQAIMVIDVATGTKNTVTQAGVALYKPTAHVNGTVVGTADYGQSLTAEGTVKAEELEIEFVNAYKDDETTTPTGLIINNLPMVALGLIIVAGFVFFVAPKRNKEEA